MVYLTGIGPLDKPAGLSDATPLQSFSRAPTAAQAPIGALPARIWFMGMTQLSVGLAQADIQIPPTLAQQRAVHHDELSMVELQYEVSSTD